MNRKHRNPISLENTLPAVFPVITSHHHNPTSYPTTSSSYNSQASRLNMASTDGPPSAKKRKVKASSKTPANVPESEAEMKASPADKILYEMRLEGTKWDKIAEAIQSQLGEEWKPDTLRKRHRAMMSNFQVWPNEHVRSLRNLHVVSR